MRISIFGDSILEGVRLENGKYTRDSELFRRFEAENHVQLLNRSRFGSTISRGAKALDRSVEKHELGDYTILEFGGNDCDHDWAQVAAAPDERHLCATPEDQFACQYGRMIDEIRANGSIPVATALPPISAQRYFSWICRRGLDGKAILRWLGDIQNIARRQALFSQISEQVAREKGCPILDLRSVFPKNDLQRDACLCEDGIHPNQAGQKLMFESFARFLRTVAPA